MSANRTSINLDGLKPDQLGEIAKMVDGFNQRNAIENLAADVFLRVCMFMDVPGLGGTYPQITVEDVIDRHDSAVSLVNGGKTPPIMATLVTASVRITQMIRSRKGGNPTEEPILAKIVMSLSDSGPTPSYVEVKWRDKQTRRYIVNVDPESGRVTVTLDTHGAPSGPSTPAPASLAPTPGAGIPR